jgi:hypothetical protein
MKAFSTPITPLMCKLPIYHPRMVNTLKSCRHLFNWIWPPIIQGELDHFTLLWNMHKIQTQNNKIMPSGATPTDIYTSPHRYCGRRFAILIPKEAVTEMCSTISMTYEDAMAWVPREFDAMANLAYEELGLPSCSAESAWDLFRDMAALLEPVLG